MNPISTPVQRHKEVTLLFLKHVRLSESGSEAGATMGELVEDLKTLGGSFMKMARVFSTRGDLLPRRYLKALGKVGVAENDGEEVVGMETVERIVEDELGEKVGRAFSYFSPEPYAFASAGQIHHAVLHGGRPVSVKVQRPSVRQRMVEDLKDLAEIASFLDGNRHGGRKGTYGRIVEHFRVNTIRELDYRREAGNLSELGRRMNGYPRILIPVVVDEFTSARVLTTDFQGGGCLRALPAEAAKGADRELLAEELLKSYLDQVLMSGFFHADPHEGNLWLTEDRQLAFSEVPLVIKTSPRLRSPLAHLLHGLCQGEILRAAEAAMRMGRIHDEESFDQIGVVREIGRLMERERDFSDDGPSVGERLLEVVRVCSRAGLQMPAEVAVIGWSLKNLNRVVAGLCPTFDVEESIRWHADLLSRERENEPIPFPAPLERVG